MCLRGKGQMGLYFPPFIRGNGCVEVGCFREHSLRELFMDEKKEVHKKRFTPDDCYSPFEGTGWGEPQINPEEYSVFKMK